MKTTAPESLRPRALSTRRFTFLTLLLLAVAAPAGLVFAEERKSPYVVVFRDEAIAQSVAKSGSYFLRTIASRPSSATNPERQVDGTRVRKHVSELRARIRVDVDNIFASALGGFSAKLTKGQLRALERDPAVAAIVPDEEITIDDGTSRVREAGGIRTTASPGSNVPAGIRRVGAQRNKLARVDGHDNRINADVAVIDTGIERNHPDLNVAGGYDCTSRNRDSWDDVDGHGTHVAGIIGAKDNGRGVVGVAPGVRLWSVKVLGPRGSGRMSWLVCGIDWVTSQREKGNQARPRFEVANMSLSFSLPRNLNRDCGRDLRDAVHNAICRSVAKGTVYVVAAGNEARNARQNRPAAYDEVITVSAMADHDGRGGGRSATDTCPYWTPERDDGFTTFSNYGSDVDLIAPGRCILSTYPRKRYAWMSGTSMASPHVAGAAAVYRAMYPRATPSQVRMALKAVGTRDWRTNTDPDEVHEKAVWIGSFRTMPDFSSTATVGSGRVAAGSSIRVTVHVTRIGGFEDPVSILLSDPPKGITASEVTAGADGLTFRVRVGNGVTAGRYNLTVTSRSGDVERASTITVYVESTGPRASFTSPGSETTVTYASTFEVAWTEARSAAALKSRTLTRQSARIRNAGECDNLDYRNDRTQTRSSPVSEKLASGYCYRWVLTLRDRNGSSSTTESGHVLVDRSAPRAPFVALSDSDKANLVDATAVGRGAYLGNGGTIWVRGGSSGRVELQVTGSDPESGIAYNSTEVERATGWHASWLGHPSDGRLRLRFDAMAREALLKVTTTNGAGLRSEPTVGLLWVDADAPTAVSWVSARTDTTIKTRSTRFVLDWRGGSDDGSGLARSHRVERYVAPLTSSGECRDNSFDLDVAPTLRSDGSVDSDLAVGRCYVWGVRTLDHVGNAAGVVWSGYVIVERNKR